MNAPAFQFYAQDFLTGVMYLTSEEKGIYITMLCKQWTDGKIPKKRLGFLVGLEWESFSDELKEKFEDCGEYVVNNRLESERNKKSRYVEKQVENGKKGGRPRKTDDSEDKYNTQIKNSKTQTKAFLIEDEDEIEKEEVIEKKEKPQRFDLLKIPESFKPLWIEWLEYRKDKKKKPYAGPKWEQIAIDKFVELSSNDPIIAKKILEQTISKNWEGFFELKSQAPTSHQQQSTFQTNR